MLAPLAAESSLSGGALAAVVVILLIELVLVVVSLIDIIRRPAVLGGHKWVWVVVVLVFNLIGPIIYLAIGRVAPPAQEVPLDADATRDRAAGAADLLYGPRPGDTGADDAQDSSQRNG